MSNPFKKITKKSEDTKSELYQKGITTKTSTTTRCCDSCGAPRPKKSNLTRCDYCKQTFMENVGDFKADI
jgi:hypothetical protein